MKRLAALATTIAGLGGAGPAAASCHLMDVVEVFGGTSGDPNAHYVVLRMTFNGQTFINGTSITVNAGTFGTFSANIGMGGCTTAGCEILMATTEAQALFAIAADGTAPGTTLLATPADQVTYSCSLDSVMYGAGSVPDLVPGCALHRSGASWTLGDPTPTNNAGASGSLPGSCVLPDAGVPEPAPDLGMDMAPSAEPGPELGPDLAADTGADAPPEDAPPPDGPGLDSIGKTPDQGSPDAGADSEDDGGCSCRLSPGVGGASFPWTILGLVPLLRRRRSNANADSTVRGAYARRAAA